MPSAHSPPRASALALLAGTCHKGRVRRLRDFASIVAMLSDQEIDEMQVAIDARRETRAVSPDEPPEARTSRLGAKPDETGLGPCRVVGV